MRKFLCKSLECHKDYCTNDFNIDDQACVSENTLIHILLLNKCTKSTYIDYSYNWISS